MADKQITELPSAGTLLGTEVLHVVQSGNSRSVDIDSLGLVIGGKSAYQSAVDQGFEGSEVEWLESLQGADGSDGEAGLSAYAIAVQGGFVGDETAWLASLKGEQGNPGTPGTDGLPGEPGEPGADGGQGPQGDPGPTVVPDEYGIFDEAKVTAIETADVDHNMLIIAGGDERIDQNVPAALAGDMSGHLVRYETGGSWFDLGPIVGVAGPQGAQGNPGTPGTAGTPGANGADGADGADGAPAPMSFELLIGHPSGIAAGGYPMTFYVGRATTLTRAAYVSDEAVDFVVTIGGEPVLSETASSAKQVDAVEIDVEVGDEIVVEMDSSSATYFGLTLVEI